jgi:hypothetical protein
LQGLNSYIYMEIIFLHRLRLSLYFFQCELFKDLLELTLTQCIQLTAKLRYYVKILLDLGELSPGDFLLILYFLVKNLLMASIRS